MNVRELFKGALKIALAMFFAVLALCVVGGLAWKAIDYRDKQSAKQYEVPKEWSVDLTRNLQLQLRAKTKLVEGQLFVSVRVDGYPAFLSEPPLSTQNSQGHFLLAFVDKDGFKLFEKEVPLSAMSQAIGSNGKVSGFDYQFSEYTSASEYPKFAKLDVGWNFNVEMPKNAIPVAPINANPQDH